MALMAITAVFLRSRYELHTFPALSRQTYHFRLTFLIEHKEITLQPENTMEPALSDSLQNVSNDTTLHMPEQGTTDPMRDERSQPWKQHLEKIQKYNRENNIGTELFRVSEGLNDHSVAA